MFAVCGIDAVRVLGSGILVRTYEHQVAMGANLVQSLLMQEEASKEGLQWTGARTSLIESMLQVVGKHRSQVRY